MKVGLIGPGVMGKGMIRNIKKNDIDISFYGRTSIKYQDLINEGIKNYLSIKELVLNNDIIITIVGMPYDVEEVYFGKDMILDNVTPKQILIDMTTSSPELALKIYEHAKAKNVHALDCPVTGGDAGARNGTLTIFVGGDQIIYNEIYPLLKSMGSTIYYAGTASMGQHAKLANQIGIAGAISAMAEMLAYADKNGLKSDELIDVWASGSAGSWQLKNMAPRVLKGDLEPGFYIKHFIKDMKLAQKEAFNNNLNLEMLDTVLKMYETMQKEGYENKGTQALIEYYLKKKN